MTDWVMVETSILREARVRLGLSYETVARKLPVASKTYERWEKAGRVPRIDLPRIAEILELEVEQPNQRPLRIVAASNGGDALDVILKRLDRIDRSIAQLRAEIAALQPSTSGTSVRRAATRTIPPKRERH